VPWSPITLSLEIREGLWYLSIRVVVLAVFVPGMFVLSYYRVFVYISSCSAVYIESNRA